MNGWLTFAIGVVTGFALVYVVPKLLWLILWMFSKTTREGSCQVCAHYPRWRTGEVRNLRYQWGLFAHDTFWSRRRWHREAWAQHRWNLSHSGEGLKWRHLIHCQVCEAPGDDEEDVSPFEVYRSFDQSGPYLTESAALPVARDHEVSLHGGDRTTRIEMM